MPWTAKSFLKHNRKLRSAGAKKQRQAAHVANSMLDRGYSEGRAIAAANSVAGKAMRSKKKRTSTSRRRSR